MPIVVVCPHCGQHGDVSRAAAGHDVTCSACGKPFPVAVGSGQLTVEWGLGLAGRHFPMTPGRDVHIGRAPDNEVVLSGPQVSRHHAVIRWEDGLWNLYDLKSANGTRVDGNLVPLATLATGRRIAIDEFVLRVTIAGETADRQMLDDLLEESAYQGPATQPRPVPAPPRPAVDDSASAEDTMFSGAPALQDAPRMDAAADVLPRNNARAARHSGRGVLLLMAGIMFLIAGAAGVYLLW